MDIRSLRLIVLSAAAGAFLSASAAPEDVGYAPPGTNLIVRINGPRICSRPVFATVRKDSRFIKVEKDSRSDLAKHGLVIDDLLKAGLLDDAMFAANYIDYLKTTGIGRIKAVFKLKNKGVPQDIIQEAMGKNWGMDDGDDDQRAIQAAKSKWQSLKNKKDWPDIKKRQAVARFLAGRGFPMDVIRRVLEVLKVS